MNKVYLQIGDSFQQFSPMAYIFRVAISDEDECCLEEDYACEEGERYMSSQEAVNAALDYVLSNLLSKEQ